MIILPFVLFAIWSRLSISQSIGIDTQTSLTPGGVAKPIKQILVDSTANYIIHYMDETITVFDSTFRPLRSASFPEPVENMEFSRFAPPPLLLTNTTLLPFVPLDVVAAFSNNRTRVRYFNASDFTILAQFDAGEYIISQRAAILVGAGWSARKVAVILVCVSTIRTGESGNLSVFYNYSQYKAGLVAASSLADSYMWSGSSGYVSMQEKYFYSMIDTNVYIITVTVRLDYQNSGLVMSTSSNAFSPLIKLPEAIDKYFIVNTVNQTLVMQSSTLELYMIKITMPNLGYVSPALSGRKILQLVNLYGLQFFLYNNSITQINYNYANYSVIQGISLFLPPALYQIVASQKVTFLYREGSTHLTRVHPQNCSASQTLYNSSTNTCQAYNCTDPNCISCSWDADHCEQCSNGYTINANNTCETITSSQAIQKIGLFSTLLNGISACFGAVISAPGGRSAASPLFYYFSNFDSIYFYRFHDRTFGPTVTFLLGNISEIQDKKWNMVDINTMYSLFSVDAENVTDSLDFQKIYPFYNYQTINHQAQDMSGLLRNNLSFFLVNVPILLIIFLIFRFIFRLISKHPISRFLRSCSLWGTFMVLCFDGNIQQFTFYLTEELWRIFSFSFSQKFLKFTIILFALLVLLISTAGLLVCYAWYKKLNFYLCDNLRNSLGGVSIQTIHFGLYNFVLGVANSLLRLTSYSFQLSLILATQMIYCYISIISLAQILHRVKAKGWITVGLTFLRIILLFSLYLDHGKQGYFIFEMMQQTVIFSSLGLFFFGVLYGFIDIFLEFFANVRSMLGHCFNQTSNSQKKVNKVEISKLMHGKRHSYDYKPLRKINPTEPSPTQRFYPKQIKFSSKKSQSSLKFTKFIIAHQQYTIKYV